MKKNVLLIGLVFIMALCGCNSRQEIPPEEALANAITNTKAATADFTADKVFGLKTLFNSVKENGIDATVKLPDLMSMMKGADDSYIEADFAVNFQKGLASIGLDYTIKDNKLFEVSGILNEELVQFTLPEISDAAYFIKYKDLLNPENKETPIFKMLEIDEEQISALKESFETITVAEQETSLFGFFDDIKTDLEKHYKEYVFVKQEEPVSLTYQGKKSNCDVFELTIPKDVAKTMIDDALTSLVDGFNKMSEESLPTDSLVSAEDVLLNESEEGSLSIESTTENDTEISSEASTGNSGSFSAETILNSEEYLALWKNIGDITIKCYISGDRVLKQEISWTVDDKTANVFAVLPATGNPLENMELIVYIPVYTDEENATYETVNYRLATTTQDGTNAYSTSIRLQSDGQDFAKYSFLYDKENKTYTFTSASKSSDFEGDVSITSICGKILCDIPGEDFAISVTEVLSQDIPFKMDVNLAVKTLTRDITPGIFENINLITMTEEDISALLDKLDESIEAALGPEEEALPEDVTPTPPKEEE